MMADKDILEFVESPKNIIDVDSNDENKIIMQLLFPNHTNHVADWVIFTTNIANQSRGKPRSDTYTTRLPRPRNLQKMNLSPNSQSNPPYDAPERKFIPVGSSSEESLIGSDSEDLAKNSKPAKRARIEQAKRKRKVPRLARKPKARSVKHSKRASSTARKKPNVELEMKPPKKLSPSISQYSGESEYENPECKTLSYYS
ncbi:hypothetical protein TNCV_1458231 [Trichonephila clavipes]|nr:hypothetical protein TNCV_1458231 [Trichonephila clavipes]